ncbi:MAG: energy transducer TonB [Bacteroidales bacterium]|nr:energy transducer TonB [Bacteroidales bacterium]
MKKLLTILILFLAVQFAFGQNGCNDTLVYDSVDVAPEFPGGDSARSRYLRDNIPYPRFAHTPDPLCQGMVFVLFVIEKDGTTSNVEVVRGLECSWANEIAIDLVRNMPKWEPGQRDGKPVRTRFFMPIRFVRHGG